MRILCSICARGGSVGVKNKNIKLLRGKPLIAHSIHQAKRTGLFDYVVVSSDSPRIRETALLWGADFAIERPQEMATSAAPKVPVIQHALLTAEKKYQTQFDIIVDLDATSPLRNVDDIRESLDMFLANQEADNLVTATPSRRSPYFNMLETNPNSAYIKLVKTPDNLIHCRQNTPVCFDMNASIYIWKRDTLLTCQTTITDKTLLYVMPEERSHDIDSPLDWQFVKLLAKNREDL